MKKLGTLGLQGILDQGGNEGRNLQEKILGFGSMTLLVCRKPWVWSLTSKDKFNIDVNTNTYISIIAKHTDYKSDAESFGCSGLTALGIGVMKGKETVFLIGSPGHQVSLLALQAQVPFMFCLHMPALFCTVRDTERIGVLCLKL